MLAPFLGNIGTVYNIAKLEHVVSVQAALNKYIQFGIWQTSGTACEVGRVTVDVHVDRRNKEEVMMNSSAFEPLIGVN